MGFHIIRANNIIRTHELLCLSLPSPVFPSSFLSFSSVLSTITKVGINSKLYREVTETLNRVCCATVMITHVADSPVAANDRCTYVLCPVSPTTVITNSYDAHFMLAKFTGQLASKYYYPCNSLHCIVIIY